MPGAAHFPSDSSRQIRHAVTRKVKFSFLLHAHLVISISLVWIVKSIYVYELE